MLIRRIGGGNIFTRKFRISVFWEVINRIARIIGGGGGAVWGLISRPLKRTHLFPVPELIKAITIKCPYCESSVINLNIRYLTRHIRETHPEKLVNISNRITQIVGLGYSDIEAIIFPPEEIVPKQYKGKPLIAEETITVRVKKESKYDAK